MHQHQLCNFVAPALVHRSSTSTSSGPGTGKVEPHAGQGPMAPQAGSSLMRCSTDCLCRSIHRTHPFFCPCAGRTKLRTNGALHQRQHLFVVAAASIVRMTTDGPRRQRMKRDVVVSFLAGAAITTTTTINSRRRRRFSAAGRLLVGTGQRPLAASGAHKSIRFIICWPALSGQSGHLVGNNVRFSSVCRLFWSPLGLARPGLAWQLASDPVLANSMRRSNWSIATNSSFKLGIRNRRNRIRLASTGFDCVGFDRIGLDWKKKKVAATAAVWRK